MEARDPEAGDAHRGCPRAVQVPGALSVPSWGSEHTDLGSGGGAMGPADKAAGGAVPVAWALRLEQEAVSPAARKCGEVTTRAESLL